MLFGEQKKVSAIFAECGMQPVPGLRREPARHTTLCRNDGPLWLWSTFLIGRRRLDGRALDSKGLLTGGQWWSSREV